MSLDLQHQLETLYGLERRRDKLGLGGTRALLEALGHPERRFRAIHVAGTNGKGSTCALIERALRASGIRTGLFTSPHLVDFRERIRVSGQWADDTRLAQRLEYVQSLPAGKDRTFFEVCTALGFDDFAARGVEWAVVEVGLGGRLDTTNVLDPEVCAITSIGLDHTEILGDTVEAIARAKAGIVKPGVPVVLAPALDPRARDVIAAIAAERGAPVIDAAPARPIEPAGGAGGFLSANAATARAVLAVLARAGVALPAEAAERGLALARWPGRFEPAPGEPRLWWDGAHNPEGLAALAERWRASNLPPPAAIVLALSRDKDADAMLAILHDLAPGAVLYATRSRSERALEPEALAARARAAGFEPRLAPSVADACRAALATLSAAHARLGTRTPRRLVLLTGSLFAIGEAMEAYGGAPGEWL